MIKVSVIITTFNESINILKRAVDSVLKQTMANIEIIIILDNPNNVILKYFLNTNYVGMDNIIIIFNQENLGPGLSRNQGLKVAKGKYIAICDADDECAYTRIEKQYNFLKKNDNVDLVFTEWKEIDIKQNKTREVKLQKYWFSNIKKYFFFRTMLLHPTMMIKKEVITKYQYPNLRRGEDFSLFITLMKNEIVFDLIQEPLYFYYVTKSDMDIHFIKLQKYSKDYLKKLQTEFHYFLFNPYFWFMFLKTFSIRVLTINKSLFMLINKSFVK